jgi:GDP-L-fucose synthase
MLGILGSTGFLGTNLTKKLDEYNIKYVGGSRKLGVDARDINSLNNWIIRENITKIINLAAECGGIGLNSKEPAKLWLATTQITSTVLEVCKIHKIQKLIQLGTVCCYGNNTPIPFKEEYLMKYGFPEETNSAYGMSKLNAMFGAQAYHKQYGLNINYVLPVNLYGPHDHFDLENSHVVPALIKKMIDAKINNTPIIIWGDGSASRELFYVEDCCEALILILNSHKSDPEPINLGSGTETRIKELAEILKTLINFNNEIIWDTSKPNGQLKRCLDVSKSKELFSFTPKTSLVDGLIRTINYYKSMYGK